jgi:hypothetical protein
MQISPKKPEKIDVFKTEKNGINSPDFDNLSSPQKSSYKQYRENVENVTKVSSPILRSSFVPPPTPSRPTHRPSSSFVPPPTPTRPTARAKNLGTAPGARRLFPNAAAPQNDLAAEFALPFKRAKTSLFPTSPEKLSFEAPKSAFPFATPMPRAKTSLFPSHSEKLSFADRSLSPKISTRSSMNVSSQSTFNPFLLSSSSSSSLTLSKIDPSFDFSQRIQKASTAAIPQVKNLAPFYEAFPGLLEGAVFLKNGAEMAVFKKDQDVIKIAIRKHSEMLPSHHAKRVHAEFQTSYRELLPVFAPLTSIRLADTEFHTVESVATLYYTKQRFHPTDVTIDALTAKMIEELRGLIIHRTRADIRPSNFKMDENGLLQFIDYNMPEDEELDLDEMYRVWNTVDPRLGALLIQEDDAVFQRQLAETFPEKLGK